MEQRLEKYRTQQRRIEFYESFKAKLRKMVSFGNNSKKEEEHVIKFHEDDDENVQRSIQDKEQSDKLDDELDDEATDEILETSKRKWTMIDYLTYIVYFLFWATLYAIAIQLKFGIVYFMLSLLVGIYLNTRTGPRKANEPSAYSVFNPNVESIDGTLKAEQFEREIGIRHS